MATYMDTTELLASIKRRANIPDNQNTYTNADLLAMANEELISHVVPFFMRLHEDHLLFEEDVALVASQSDYKIPYRAVGNKIRDLQYKDSNGSFREMTKTGVGSRPDLQYSFSVSDIYSYFPKAGKVVLIPSVGTSVTGSLNFTYYLRPAELVLTSRVGVITAIDTDTGEVTVSTLPTHFSTSLEYDFYSVESPHLPLAIDKSISALDSTNGILTFTASDLPSDLQVGDHVAKANESCIPQIPSDLHTMLASRVAELILDVQGDEAGLKSNKLRNNEYELKANTLIDERVDDSPTKLVNRNSLLRQGVYKKRRR